MDPVLIAEIIEIGAELLKNHSAPGKVQDDAAIISSLTKIAVKAEQAVKEHTGQPVDPSLIKVEETV